MTYYSKEEIEEAKKIDLYNYLKIYEPDELVYVSKNTYCTKTHDSLRISNGMWYWFSKGIGGKSAVDYLIKVNGYSFIEAISKVKSRKNNSTVSYTVIKTEKANKLVLPKKNYNNDKVINYLIKRGIDEEIIYHCIDNELIYEQKENHNVVFIGVDDNKIPRYAGIRSTGEKRFMQDAYGSDKTYSFRLESQNINSKIHLFESAIDLLSYATLMKLSNKEWYNENLISLAGIYQPSKDLTNSKVPMAVENYLKRNKNIKEIIIHFDTDMAGKNAAKALQNVLNKNYDIKIIHPPIGKDFNDFLREVLIKRNKSLSEKNNFDR